VVPNDDGLVAAPGETRSPDALDTLTEDELRRFFLHLVRERQASRSTLIVYRSGIPFLVETTLRHEWPVLDLLAASEAPCAPRRVSTTEVRTLLAQVRDLRARICLTRSVRVA